MMMFALFCVLLLDVICLMIIRILEIEHVTIFPIFWMILILGVWSLMHLRFFLIEISEHVISIRYVHPFKKRTNITVLEVPLEKVISYKIERGILSNFLILDIDTNRGKRSFYYQIGILKKKESNRFRNLLNSIKSLPE